MFFTDGDSPSVRKSMRLPRWYRNHTVVSKFDIIDAPSRLKLLSKDISLKTQQMIGPSLAIFLIEVIYLCCMLSCCYVIYVVMFYFFVFPFFVRVYSTIICILWVINKLCCLSNINEKVLINRTGFSIISQLQINGCDFQRLSRNIST